MIFNPHVLYLCASPDKVRAQLGGQRLCRAEALPLRDDERGEDIELDELVAGRDAPIAARDRRRVRSTSR